MDFLLWKLLDSAKKQRNIMITNCPVDIVYTFWWLNTMPPVTWFKNRPKRALLSFFEYFCLASGILAKQKRNSKFMMLHARDPRSLVWWNATGFQLDPELWLEITPNTYTEIQDPNLLKFKLSCPLLKWDFLECRSTNQAHGLREAIMFVKQQIFCNIIS